jgi:hypothetical protein
MPVTPQRRSFKTTRVLSGVRSEYHAWKEWSEGDYLIGKLLGSSPNRKNQSKKDWIIEVAQPNFKSAAQNKRLKAGTRLTLNSAGQFDKGIEQIEIGDMFQVTYNGCHEMEGGNFAGQMAHTMEVVEVEEDKDDDDNGAEEEETYEDEEEAEEDL